MRCQYLLIVFCLWTTCLYAQDNKDGDIYKENYELRNALKESDKLVENLSKQVEKLKADYGKVLAEKHVADSLLKSERDFGRSKDVRAQIQKLQEYNMSLNLLHETDSVTIDDLRQELASLYEFKRLWVAQMVSAVDENWQNKYFSQIDSLELEQTLNQYEKYSSMDEAIAAAHDKLHNLKEEYKIYLQGVNVVNSSYAAHDVNMAARAVNDLQNHTTNAKRKEELSRLSWQLKYYGVTIEIFQDIIKAVDNTIESQSSYNAAWPLVEICLSDLEKKDGYISALKEIPWTDKQYEMFLKELETYLKNNKDIGIPIHDAIMSLQP